MTIYEVLTHVRVQHPPNGTVTFGIDYDIVDTRDPSYFEVRDLDELADKYEMLESDHYGFRTVRVLHVNFLSMN